MWVYMWNDDLGVDSVWNVCDQFQNNCPWLGFSSFAGMFHSIAFNTLSVVAIYTHWQAMTTDPGAVPKEARPLPTDDQEYDPEVAANRSTPYKKYCRRCKAFKPTRAHHCSICQRCIVKMDHHCPWVNNCVGIGNTKLFLQFLLAIFLMSVYAIALLALKFVNCSISRKSKYYCPSSPGDAVFVVGVLVEGILFGLFTLCMLADQSETISSNQTQIDRLKNVRHDIQDDIDEVFGTPTNRTCHSSWFLPTKAEFPPKFKDKIYGFVLPQSTSMSYLDENSTELTPLHVTSTVHDETLNSCRDGKEPGVHRKDDKEAERNLDDTAAFQRNQAFMRKRVNTPENSN